MTNSNLPTPQKSGHRIFVTGSTGFIGSHFIRAALLAGHEVIALRYPGSQPVIPIPDSDRLTWIDGDLNSFLLAGGERKEDGSSQIEDSQSGEDGRSKIEAGFANNPPSPISHLLSPSPLQTSSGSATASHLQSSPSASQHFSISDSSSAKQLATCNEQPATSSGSSSASHLQSSNSRGEAALVHFAAYGVSPQPCTWEKAFQINVTDSLSLIERAIDRGISHVILCGTCMEYGASAERYEFIPPDAPLEPVGPYAASKAALSMAATALCTERGAPLSILRLFTVYGEGQHPSNFWPSLRKAALAGEDFPMTPGEQIRDFVPVETVANYFLQEVQRLTQQPTTDNQQHIRIANVGTGRAQTIRAFAEHWWKEWGAKGKLLPGALPYRDNEVMRYVPEVTETLKR